MQQNTPPQAPICHRTPPSPPRRRVRSRKLVCAACRVTPSLAQEVAAPPLFAHADLRAACFAFSAAGELGACASRVCPRLLRAHVSCALTSPACPRLLRAHVSCVPTSPACSRLLRAGRPRFRLRWTGA
uniref:Uncharacterized protein n=1 Tax=Rousettus aegyptiacus TaxID=9407 RepID=A0A7J8H1I9_ROUAE|nr:hypothetical protein HJG63_011449 [Rousettus aegyptiacus]